MAATADAAAVSVRALPPPAGVRVRAGAVTWGWRVFLGSVYLILFGPLVILALFAFNDSNVLAFPIEGVTTHWFADAFRDNPMADELRRVLVARNHGPSLDWQGIDPLAAAPGRAEAVLERVIATRIRARFARLGIAYHSTSRP